jgi:deoxyribodipyrimidine photo-lyase
MPGSIMWFRRDLRLHDQPALAAAARDGAVTPLFVLDPRLLAPAGSPRTVFLLRSLAALREDLEQCGARLVVRTGDPVDVVPQVVAEAGAGSVHVSADFGPYGAARDARVESALRKVPFVRTGSAYAVSPGRIVNKQGEPYKVYSAFYRAWLDHGWRAPAALDPGSVTWHTLESETLPDEPSLPHGMTLPAAGESAALAAWRSFRDTYLSSYAAERDRPDLDHTSRLSVYLKYGAIHPRTILAELGASDETYRKELAWREFYADVLQARPDSARQNFQKSMDALRHDEGPEADERFDAWCEGRTGYPIVDAGMRQLRAEGWMHNRVRMIVASFLVKDLHIPWWRGARHFMRYLVDGDIASNSHGWQWTAGTGTDAAPYFRVFNPIMQGKKFDPDGSYIRRWVPELAAVGAHAVHEPWSSPQPDIDGYPAPIVDHAAERAEALARYEQIRQYTR